MHKMKMMLALIALMTVMMVGCLAVAEQAPQDANEALLNQLTTRQSELLDKAYANTQPEDETQDVDLYSPEAVKKLAALTPQEEEQFNKVYAQIDNIMDEYTALEEQWAKAGEGSEGDALTEQDEQFLAKVEEINQRLDALWVQVMPQVNKMELARTRQYLKDLGFADAEVERYMASNERTQALNTEMEQAYEGWAEADDKGKEAIQAKADAIYAKIADENASIGDLIDKMNQVENDRYYAGLTALTQAERDELRGIEQQLNELYKQMALDEPGN